MGSLVNGRGEFPGSFAGKLVGAVWKRMAIEYAHNAMEVVRCLTQLWTKSDWVGKLKRPANRSHGRGFPNTFDMTSGKEYWGMYFLPKIDFETIRDEYRSEIHNALVNPPCPPPSFRNLL